MPWAYGLCLGLGLGEHLYGSSFIESLGPRGLGSPSWVVGHLGEVGRDMLSSWGAHWEPW